MEVDCWATGIILYIILCGYPPFKTLDRNQEELFQMIQKGKFTYDPEYWNSISASKCQPVWALFEHDNGLILDAKNLIDHLLVVDRHKRLRADDILLHPWILTCGQTKSPRNVEDLKTIARLKYEMKMKEYAGESTGS